jgi:hypothetical protein
MTLFEYLAIAFSLVLSSAAMRLMGGLPHAFDKGKRYWVHFCFLVLGLATTAVVFWVYWSYRDATWDLLGFLVALAHLGLVYFLATTIVPENPGNVDAWREYYYSVRSRYFSAAILFALTSTAMPSLLLGMPLNHPARLVHTCMLLIGVVGVSTADNRIHGGMVACAALALAVSIGTVFLRASALSG